MRELVMFALLTSMAGAPAALPGPLQANYHPGQWEYVTSEDIRIAVMCGRQWGKTTGNRGRAWRNLTRAKRTLYIHMVRENAEEQFFRPLMTELSEAGWDMGAAANYSKLLYRAPNGGKVKAWSADDVRDVRVGRGFQWDEVLLEEAQSFPEDVIAPLMDQVIVPTLFRTGGTIAMTGTPPDVEGGYFIRAIQSGRWRVLGGSIFQNPWIPEENVRAAYAARGIGPGHPIWEREVMGRMVIDPDALAYAFQRDRNTWTTLKRDAGRWRYSMGLDLGFQDKDAIVVLGWDRDDGDRRLFEVYRWQANHQDVDQLAARVREVVREFRPVIVGDHGGHGAVKVLETLRNRMGIAINAKPADVMASVGLVNDDLRSGRLMIEQGSPLADELLRVTRTVKNGRTVINQKGFHSDLSEALRYAHHAARHWSARAPKPEPTLDERRRAWEQREQRELEDPYGD